MNWNDPEECRAHQRAYYAKNRERIRKHQQKWEAKKRAERGDVPDPVKAERNRIWRANNPEKARASDERGSFKMRKRGFLVSGEAFSTRLRSRRESGQGSMTGIEVDGRPAEQRESLDHGGGSECPGHHLRNSWEAGW